MHEVAISGLSEEESAAWASLISVTMWLPAALDIQLERDEGISNFEYGALVALAHQPEGSMRIKDFAQSANSTLPRMSKMMNRFERWGWVQRHPDPADGRATLAVLTPAGYRKLAGATPRHVAHLRKVIFDNLSPMQIHQLGVIASIIADASGPNGACAPNRR